MSNSNLTDADGLLHVAAYAGDGMADAQPGDLLLYSGSPGATIRMGAASQDTLLELDPGGDTITLRGTVAVPDRLTVTGQLETPGGGLQLNGALAAEAASIDGALEVTHGGALRFAADSNRVLSTVPAEFAGGASFSNNVAVDGDLTVGGLLGPGLVTVEDRLRTRGDAEVEGRFAVVRAADGHELFAVRPSASNAPATAEILAGADARVAGKLEVDSDVSATSALRAGWDGARWTLEVASASNAPTRIAGDLDVARGLEVGSGGVSTSGALRGEDGARVVGDSVFRGDVRAEGALAVVPNPASQSSNAALVADHAGVDARRPFVARSNLRVEGGLARFLEGVEVATAGDATDVVLAAHAGRSGNAVVAQRDVLARCNLSVDGKLTSAHAVVATASGDVAADVPATGDTHLRRRTHVACNLDVAGRATLRGGFSTGSGGGGAPPSVLSPGVIVEGGAARFSGGELTVSPLGPSGSNVLALRVSDRDAAVQRDCTFESNVTFAPGTQMQCSAAQASFAGLVDTASDTRLASGALNVTPAGPAAVDVPLHARSNLVVHGRGTLNGPLFVNAGTSGPAASNVMRVEESGVAVARDVVLTNGSKLTVNGSALVQGGPFAVRTTATASNMFAVDGGGASVQRDLDVGRDAHVQRSLAVLAPASGASGGGAPAFEAREGRVTAARELQAASNVRVLPGAGLAVEGGELGVTPLDPASALPQTEAFRVTAGDVSAMRPVRAACNVDVRKTLRAWEGVRVDPGGGDVFRATPAGVHADGVDVEVRDGDLFVDGGDAVFRGGALAVQRTSNDSILTADAGGVRAHRPTRVDARLITAGRVAMYGDPAEADAGGPPAVLFANTQTVPQSVTFNRRVDVACNLDVEGALSVAQAAQLRGGLTTAEPDGDVDVGGDLTARGDTEARGRLTARRAVEVTDGDGSSNFGSGRLIARFADDAVSVAAPAIEVEGALTSKGGGGATFAHAVYVKEDAADADGDAAVAVEPASFVRIARDLRVRNEETDVRGRALRVFTAGATAAPAFAVESNAVVAARDTRVDSNLAVAGDVDADGDARVGGALTVDADADVGGSSTVAAQISVATALVRAGGLRVLNSSNAAAPARFATSDSNVSVGTEATLAGDVSVVGGRTVDVRSGGALRVWDALDAQPVLRADASGAAVRPELAVHGAARVLGGPLAVELPDASAGGLRTLAAAVDASAGGGAGAAVLRRAVEAACNVDVACNLSVEGTTVLAGGLEVGEGPGDVFAASDAGVIAGRTFEARCNLIVRGDVTLDGAVASDELRVKSLRADSDVDVGDALRVSSADGTLGGVLVAEHAGVTLAPDVLAKSNLDVGGALAVRSGDATLEQDLLVYASADPGTATPVFEVRPQRVLAHRGLEASCNVLVRSNLEVLRDARVRGDADVDGAVSVGAGLAVEDGATVASGDARVAAGTFAVRPSGAAADAFVVASGSVAADTDAWSVDATDTARLEASNVEVRNPGAATAPPVAVRATAAEVRVQRPTVVDDALDVSGDAHLLAGLRVGCNAVVEEDLTVSGDADVAQSALVRGALTARGAARFEGDTLRVFPDANNAVAVLDVSSNDVTVRARPFHVDDADTRLTGALLVREASGGTTVLSVSDAGGVRAERDVQANRDLGVAGDAMVGGDAVIGSNLVVSGSAVDAADAVVTARRLAIGDSGIASDGPLDVGATFAVRPNVPVDGDTTAVLQVRETPTYGVDVRGPFTVDGDADITGAARVRAGLAVEEAGSACNVFTADGAAGVQVAGVTFAVSNADAFVAGGGTFTVEDALVAEPGSNVRALQELRVEGGSGLDVVSGDARVGGSAEVVGALDVGSDAAVVGQLDVGADALVAGGVQAGDGLLVRTPPDDATLGEYTFGVDSNGFELKRGEARVEGGAYFGGAVQFDSDVAVAAGLSVQNEAVINGELRVLEGQILADAGLDTAGAPAFAWVSSPAAGMFSPTADAVALSTAGAERLRVTPAGDVMVGGPPTAAQAKLHVQGTVRADDAVRAADGTAGAPAFAWWADPDTGMYRPAPGVIAFAAEGTEQFRITTDGVEITGGFRATDQLEGHATDTAAEPSFTWKGDLNTGMFRPAADAVAFTTGGTERARVTPTGRVGIGTQAPAEALDVVGSARASGQVLGGAGASNAPGWTFVGDSDTGFYAPGDDAVSLALGGVERVRFDSNGNVGFGMLDAGEPVTRVDVRGDVRTTAGQFLGAFDDSAAAPAFSWHDDKDTGVFRADSNVLGLATAGVERVRVTEDGRVGVGGVAAPTQRLHVAGAVRATERVLVDAQGTAAAPAFAWTQTSNTGIFLSAGDSSVAVSAAGVERARFTPNGRLGVGVAAPTDALHVRGGNIRSESNVRADDRVEAGFGTVTRPAYGWYGDPDTGVYRPEEDVIAFTSGGVEQFRITPQGVNITGGFQSSDGVQGSISDSAAAPSFMWDGDTNTGMFSAAQDEIGFSTGGAERVRIDDVGNVGFGVADPAHAVDVAGSVRATGPFLAPQGTAPAPGYTFAADSNTGLFQPGLGALAVSAGGSERVRFDAAGNVGFGTNAPQTRVDVAGDVRVRGGGRLLGDAADTAAAPSFSWYANADTGLFFPGAQTLGVSTAGAERVRVLASGRVGIGLSAPAEQLHVAGKLLATQQVLAGADGAAATPAFSWSDNSNTGVYFDATSGNASEHALAFSIDGVRRLFVQSDGGVGIGLSAGSAAAARLHVANGSVLAEDGVRVPSGVVETARGTEALPAYAFVGDLDTGVYSPAEDVVALTAGGAEQLRITPSGVEITGNFQTDGALLGDPGDTEVEPSFAWREDLDTGMFRAGSNAIGFTTSGAERVRVDADGRVGVGVAAPTADVDVQGPDGGVVRARGAVITGAGSAALPGFAFHQAGESNDTGAFMATDGSFALAVGASEAARFTAAGNAGFGTTAPDRRVDVAGDARVTGGQFLGDPADSASAPSFAWDGDAGSGWFRVASNVVALSTASTERLRVNDTGRVGVGVTAPTTALDVQGDVRARAAFQSSDGTAAAPAYAFYADSDTGAFRPAGGGYAWTVDGAERARISPSGNAGFGVTAPSARVDVSGDVRALGGQHLADPADSSNAPGFAWDGDADTGAFHPGADQMAVATAGVERVHVGATGAVGIGTSPAAERLHVSGGKVRADGQVLGAAAGTGDAATPAYAFVGASNTGAFLTSGDGSLAWAVDGAERARLTAAGRLGVQQASPQHALDVGGGARFAQPVLGDASAGPAAPSYSWDGDTDTGMYLAAADEIGFATNGTERLRITATDFRLTQDVYGNRLVAISTGTSNFPAFTYENDSNTGWYLPAPDATALATGGVERLRVDSDGRVGIAIEAPTEALDVASNVRVREQLLASDGTAGAPSVSFANNASTGVYLPLANTVGVATGGVERVRIDSAGSVGVGTAAPTARLHSVGPSRIAVQNGINGGSGQGIYMYADGNSNWGIYMATAGGSGGQSLADAPAVAGHNFGADAIRFRASRSTGTDDQGFVWETEAEERCASLNAADKSLDVVGDIRTRANAQVDSDLAVSGQLDANGDAFFAQDLHFTSNLATAYACNLVFDAATLKATGSAQVDSDLVVNGQLDANGDAFFAQDLRLTSNLATAYASTLVIDAFKLRATGGAHFYEDSGDGWIVRSPDGGQFSLAYTNDFGSAYGSAEFYLARWTQTESREFDLAFEMNSWEGSTPVHSMMRRGRLRVVGTDLQDVSGQTIVAHETVFDDDAANGGAFATFTWYVRYGSGSTDEACLSLFVEVPSGEDDQAVELKVYGAVDGATNDVAFWPLATDTNSFVRTGAAPTPRDPSITDWQTASVHQYAQLMNGNVGIGTVAPAAKLTVDGDLAVTQGVTFQDRAYLADGTAAQPALTWTADSNTGWFRPGADQIGWTTGGVERMRLLAGGNLGVNVTAPGERVDVSGAVRTDAQFLAADGSAGAPAFTWDADRDTGAFRPAADEIGLATGGTERVRIDSSGQVGIGTSTPSASLHVAALGSGNGAEGPVGNLHFTHPDNGGYNAITFGSTTNTGSDGGGVFYYDHFPQYGSIFGSGGEQGLLALNVVNDPNNDSGDHLLLNPTGAVFVDGSSSGGGTPDPSSYSPQNNARLYVLGQARTGSISWDGSTSTFSERNVLDDGSGNATFSGDVTVSGDTLLADGTAAAPSLTFAADTDTGVFRPSADALAFATAGQDRGRFQSNGYLRLENRIEVDDPSGTAYELGPSQNRSRGLSVRATSNPPDDQTLFTVESSANFNRFGVTQSNGGFFADALRVGYTYNDDTVVPTPAYTLDVDGTVRSTGDVTVEGNALFADGTAAAPSIAFAADTDTGAFRPAADEIGLTTGGTERVRVDANGRVGIGTGAPSASLHIAASGSGAGETAPVGNIHLTHPEEGLEQGYNSITFASTSNNGSDGAGIFYFDHFPQYGSVFEGGSTSDQQSVLALAVTDNPIDGNNGRFSDHLLLLPTGAVFIDGGGTSAGSNAGAPDPVNGIEPRNAAKLYVLGEARTGSLAWDGSASTFNERNVWDDGSGNATFSGDVTLAGNTLFADGTAAAPSIAFAADTDTGAFRPAADEIGLTTGGTERVRVDANGRVGIGTGAPSAELHIAASGSGAGTTGSVGNIHLAHPQEMGINGYNSITFASTSNNASDGAGIFYYEHFPQYGSIFASSSADASENGVLAFNVTNDAEEFSNLGDHILLNPSGSVFVDGYKSNMTTPDPNSHSPGNAASMYVLGEVRTGAINWDGSVSTFSERNVLDDGDSNMTVRGVARFADGTAAAPGLTFLDDQDTGVYRAAADVLAWATVGTERMRVNASGDVGINITSPSARLHVGGDIRASGEITANSDARLKTELRAVERATEKLRRVHGYTFRRKYRHEHDDRQEQRDEDEEPRRREVGLLAQEVLEVVPEAVRTDPATGLLSLAYGNMVAVLVEAARETDARLQVQEREIAELKSTVSALLRSTTDTSCTRRA